MGNDFKNQKPDLLTKSEEDVEKPKIYLHMISIWENGDVAGEAYTEDGEVLAGHISSNETFLKHDLGLTSNRKHDIYTAAYPDGYELVWVDHDPQDYK